ncbi:MAG: T9SS type B sorting domain-containing protein, partial [Lacinutrix venerupis]
LTSGNYFTASGGTGTPLNAGDTINTTQTIYIYETNGSCSDESSFDVTITSTPTVDVLNNQTACDSFTLQPLTVGNYFTASGGTGTPLNAGDTITTTQTIYIYETNGSCSDESSFNITINTTPTVDVLNNIIVCDSYILQNLNNGNYFTQPNGNGTQLNAGDIISTSQSLYIYNEINNCSAETFFNITINETPTVDILQDVVSCDSFILQPLNNGNYYSAPNGIGTPMLPGENILASQTIYIYAETSTNPNCFNESFFTVTINPSQNFNLTQSNLNIYEGELTVTMNDTSIDYQYSIDGFNYQNSNLFSGLSDGSYTLYVKDTNGCLEKTIDFTIELKQFIIPKFFTPNGDNVNETWDIIDNKNEIKLTSIFNRYGRLLTQLKTTKRWDGTYSGELLPTSDYWYIIELKNGTILKGHFSLVR